MSTYEQAVAAKDKFKEEFWKKAPEKYNVITIGLDEVWDENIDIEEVEEIEAIFYVKAFLFDINDVVELPTEIDGVEIRYAPVIEKQNVSNP